MKWDVCRNYTKTNASGSIDCRVCSIVRLDVLIIVRFVSMGGVCFMLTTNLLQWRVIIPMMILKLHQKKNQHVQEHRYGIQNSFLPCDA